MIFGENDKKLEAVGMLLARLARLDAAGSADLVATCLSEVDVRGLRKSPCDCPVHAYVVKGWNPDDYQVREITVGVASVSIWFGPDEPGRQSSRLVLDTPTHVAAFIEQFDFGAYPDLEA